MLSSRYLLGVFRHGLAIRTAPETENCDVSETRPEIGRQSEFKSTIEAACRVPRSPISTLGSLLQYGFARKSLVLHGKDNKAQRGQKARRLRPLSHFEIATSVAWRVPLGMRKLPLLPVCTTVKSTLRGLIPFFKERI